MRNPFSIPRALTAEFDSTAYAGNPKVRLSDETDAQEEITKSLDRWGDLRTPRTMRL